MFSEAVLFLETYSVLKTPGHFPGWPPWLADKGKVWVLNQLEHSLFQGFLGFLTLKSLFFIHMTPRIDDYLLHFKHKCTYLFATNLKNKHYARQE